MILIADSFLVLNFQPNTLVSILKNEKKITLILLLKILTLLKNFYLKIFNYCYTER